MLDAGVQSPWPEDINANGGVRSERFYYDGARRIQEVVTDPLITVETLSTTEGSANNPEISEIMSQTVSPQTLEGSDGSANPMSFESGQLSGGNSPVGMSGEPLPVPLSGIEREYIWGPGDNGLDELLVQYDASRAAWWMIQDGGGDVVAMCDLGGTSFAARVVKSWQYDAYGQCLRASDVVTGSAIPMNKAGHKGLFMDRLDKPVAYLNTSGVYVDNPRLEAGETVLYQNRNRTYSPQLGRFIQRDPNETGQLLAAMQKWGGATPMANGGEVLILRLYRDGGSTFNYLMNNPDEYEDPNGLESVGGTLASGAIRMGLIRQGSHAVVKRVLDQAMKSIGRQALRGGAINSAISGFFEAIKTEGNSVGSVVRAMVGGFFAGAVTSAMAGVGGALAAGEGITLTAGALQTWGWTGAGGVIGGAVETVIGNDSMKDIWKNMGLGGLGAVGGKWVGGRLGESKDMKMEKEVAEYIENYGAAVGFGFVSNIYKKFQEGLSYW